MKIWIINHYAIPPSLGGLNRHYYFAKELISRGHEVRIFTASTIHNTNINMIEGNEQFKEIEVDGLIYTYIKSTCYKGNGLSRIKNMLGFAFSLKKIKRCYKAENPDVIYTSSPDVFTAYYAQKIAKKLSIPCIIEIRDLWPLSIVEYMHISEKNPIIKFLYREERRMYRLADALIFSMEGGKDYIIEKKWDNKVDVEKVFHINNGIDVALQEKQKLQCIVEDEQLDDDKFKVVYTGSIRLVNDVGTIVKTAEVLQQRSDCKNIEFLIYGDGNEKENLEQYCAEHQLTNIYFKGKVKKEEIPYILSKCNLGILICQDVAIWKYGGSLNKLFDYMNAGMPLLTNIKMGYSLLEKYDCGIELDKGSPVQLADAISRIASIDKECYLEMCKNAKQAAQKYDFKLLTDQLITAIEYTLKK